MTSQHGAGEVIPIYLRVAPADIAYLKFLFESYEEIAIVRTVDRLTAVIVILVLRDFLGDARSVVQEVVATHACEEIRRPDEEGDDWLMSEI